MTQATDNPIKNQDFTRYTLWFVYGCVIYAIIGFSWGALMGGIPAFRNFIHGPYGHYIVLAHSHVNLLGWVEMAIFGALYYVVPNVAKRPIYSVPLVKIHFWMHNFGLIGMVAFFTAAGVGGGMLNDDKLVSHLMAFVGIFGTMVLLANIIWGYNLFRTGAGWEKRQ